MSTSPQNSPFQFDSIIDFMQKFSSDSVCKDYLKMMRWNGETKCVFCGSDNIYTRKCGHKHECRDCKKGFTTTSNTIFADSKVGMQKWFIAMYLISTNVKGISSCQLAKKVKVTQKTAWFMLHRIRYSFLNGTLEAPESGVYQLDEAYVGGKEKNKHRNKRTKGTQGRSTLKKTAVFGMRDHDGKVFNTVVPDAKESTLLPIIQERITKGSIIMTDEHVAYKGLSQWYDHRFVEHKSGEYVSGWDTTTNGMENYFSHLKRMVIGTYHQVSRKHLNLYLAGQDFRYNSCKAPDWQKFNGWIFGTTEKRLTYKNLTKKV